MDESDDPTSGSPRRLTDLPAAPGAPAPAAGTAGRRVWSARWQPLAAAGAVVLLAGGVVAIAAATGGGPAGAGPGGVATTQPVLEPWPSLAQLLVRDGDRAAGSGQVIALPGRPVRFCAPVPVAMPGYAAGHEPLPAYCDAGVNLVGADLARLDGRAEKAGIVTGRAWVEGTYRAGTLTVTRQGAWRPSGEPPRTFPDRPPCAAPAGGWAAGELDRDGLTRIQAYLTAHPDRYGELVITYPDGPPAGPTDAPGYAKTQVALVGTTGDPTAAYRELRALFPGNLCVTRLPRDRRAVDAVGQRAAPLLSDRSHWVYTTGADYYAGRYVLDLVVVDQTWYQRLTAADQGTGVIAAHPWLTPAH